jgi:hypothetical protein
VRSALVVADDESATGAGRMRNDGRGGRLSMSCGGAGETKIRRCARNDIWSQ